MLWRKLDNVASVREKKKTRKQIVPDEEVGMMTVMCTSLYDGSVQGGPARVLPPPISTQGGYYIQTHTHKHTHLNILTDTNRQRQIYR